MHLQPRANRKRRAGRREAGFESVARADAMLASKLLGSCSNPPDPYRHMPRTHEAASMKPPLWDKQNHGFWLVVCIAISVLFALVVPLPIDCPF